MSTKNWLVVAVVSLLLGLFLGACNPNPQPEGLTPIPTLALAETPTLVAAIQEPTVAVPAPEPIVPGEVDAALGAPLFLKNCTGCHGVQGEGVDAPPPA